MSMAYDILAKPASYSAGFISADVTRPFGSDAITSTRCRGRDACVADASPSIGSLRLVVPLSTTVPHPRALQPPLAALRLRNLELLQVIRGALHLPHIEIFGMNDDEAISDMIRGAGDDAA